MQAALRLIWAERWVDRAVSACSRLWGLWAPVPVRLMGKRGLLPVPEEEWLRGAVQSVLKRRMWRVPARRLVPWLKVLMLGLVPPVVGL